MIWMSIEAGIRWNSGTFFFPAPKVSPQSNLLIPIINQLNIQVEFIQASRDDRLFMLTCKINFRFQGENNFGFCLHFYLKLCISLAVHVAQD